MKTEPKISKALRAKILRWWKKGKNIWEISQLTGASETVVTIVVKDA